MRFDSYSKIKKNRENGLVLLYRNESKTSASL